jgi:hypothetical protein
MKCRGHFLVGPAGEAVITACPSNKKRRGKLPVTVIGRVVPRGTPVPPGESLFHVTPAKDGEHVLYEEVKGDMKGPPKVTSNAYRAGWSAAFGGGMKN